MSAKVPQQLGIPCRLRHAYVKPRKCAFKNGTAKAKETKRGGKAGRESERLNMTCEAGELTRRTPQRKEGRRFTDFLGGKMADLQRSELISTKQQKIATQARQAPERSFTSLNHYLDIDWLHEAFRRTRKDGAVGIDRVTAEEYAGNLEANLQGLLDRAKSGLYRAPAVRRVHIPKGDGTKTRPIGIPAFEDKVLQRAVAMVLEPIYEQDFLDCSYGFRPGRSAHQALEVAWGKLMAMGGGWLIEVDIQGFYDALDKAHLREFLHRRVRDGVLLRLIGKWLNAGVWEEGQISYPETGTPQGGVISPILSNIYLHEVMDTWFERNVRPRMAGPVFMIRFADDVIIGVAREDDAKRVMKVLPKRFGKYGLTLHPEKTRLIDFRKPGRMSGPSGPDQPVVPTAFDLLGFTHCWGKSRKGFWVVKRKTAKGRLSRAIRTIAQWCKANRHRPIKEQWQALCRKLNGHFGYYGITGNSKALGQFRQAANRQWKYWLGHRSHKAKSSWDWFTELEKRYRLPPAIAKHSILRHAANP